MASSTLSKKQHKKDELPTPPASSHPDHKRQTCAGTALKPGYMSALKPDYVSPLKRVKLELEAASRTEVVDTVDGQFICLLFHLSRCLTVLLLLSCTSDLKAFIEKNADTNKNIGANVILEARVVWTSFEQCQTGPVARMHLIDKWLTMTSNICTRYEYTHIIMSQTN